VSPTQPSHRTQTSLSAFTHSLQSRHKPSSPRRNPHRSESNSAQVHPSSPPNLPGPGPIKIPGPTTRSSSKAFISSPISQASIPQASIPQASSLKPSSPKPSIPQTSHRFSHRTARRQIKRFAHASTSSSGLTMPRIAQPSPLSTKHHATRTPPKSVTNHPSKPCQSPQPLSAHPRGAPPTDPRKTEKL